MPTTNFTKLTDDQKRVWSRDVWKIARNYSFMSQFGGTGPNSLVQRVTELTKTEKGDRAIINLVADLESDGVAGDNRLKGHEEEIKAYDQFIVIDQLRHANRNTGRMADQRSVINFREQSRDVLGYWLADRTDQMAFLTLSGVSYAFHTNGAPRVGSALPDLEFAATVTAPSAARHVRWDATNGIVAGDTTAVDTPDTPSYAMLVNMKAHAKNEFIRGIKQQGNDEVYHVFMSPDALAKLKLDPDFVANLRNAGARGEQNQIFKGGASYYMDGMHIHEFRHSFNTKGAASGSKWGASGTVNGNRILLCGAQALAMADLGPGYWDEDMDDFNNNVGIAYGKIFGLLKPSFKSHLHKNTKEDFGVLCVDVAI